MENLNFQSINTDSDEISLLVIIIKVKEWLLYLKKKIGLILFVSIICGAIGYGKAYMQKKIYTASLSFALEDGKSGGGLTGALGLASSLGIDLETNAGGAFSGANLIELMMSRTLVERALLNPITIDGNTISLAEFYLNFSGIRNSLDKNESLSGIHYLVKEDRTKYSQTKDSLLGIIYQSIVNEGGGFLSVAQKDKKISIINVDVKTNNEKFSKILCESIVSEVTDFYIITKSKKARTNVAILQKQADSIRLELNSAITGVASALDNTFNLNPSQIVRKTPSTKRQVDVQANTAILTQLVTNLEMAKVTLMKETPFIQIIDRPILPLKYEKAGKLKSLILGGFFGIFLSIFFFISKKMIGDILKQIN